MSNSTVQSSTALSPSKIASYAIQDPRHPQIEVAQVKHRIQLIGAWNISSGARVLEIGCGQGNCTTVLAEAVGPIGHIDAVDPAPGDYGAPFTLAQAQAHITASEVGSRITWHEADPLAFLASNNKTWDFVVLSHCIWYMKSSSVVKALLHKLEGRVSKICIAEYALTASHPAATAHVLATFARATLEAHRDSSENIQSPLSPTGIKDIASEGKYWSTAHEITILPEPDLDDGRWEVGTVAHAGFLEDVLQGVKEERIDLVLQSMRFSVLAAVEAIGGLKKCQTMDVWAAVLVPQETKQ